MASSANQSGPLPLGSGAEDSRAGDNDTGGPFGCPLVRWKVEFWTLNKVDDYRKQWKLFGTAYYDRFEEILTKAPVADWRALGGLWSETELRIQEEELDAAHLRQSGQVWYFPVCHI